MNKKIFFLLFIFTVLIRLWHINQPLLDAHSWRQTASAMVARNYLSDMNFFKPVTDFDPPHSLFSGLYEYLVAALAKLFGFSDLLGRLTSLGLFLIGFVYYYKLVLRFTSQYVALIACAFYSFLPVSVFYSRAFQTDSGMVSLTVIFLYYFILWTDGKKTIHFLMSVLFANLAFLFKILSLFILIPAVGYFVMRHKTDFFKKPLLYFFLFLSMAFPLFYNWWAPIAANGQIESAFFNQDKWANVQTLKSFKYWYETFFANQFEFQYMHTGYVFLIIGLYKNIKNVSFRLFYLWAIGVCLFFIAAAKGVFHEYYLLPLIPAACVFIGGFLAEFFTDYYEKQFRGRKDKIKFGLVCFMIFYCFAFSLVRLNQRLQLEGLHYLKIADAIKQNTEPSERITVISHSEPEVIYYSERRGTHIHIKKQEELPGAIERSQNIQKNGNSILAITDFCFEKELPGILSKFKKSSIIFEGKEGVVIKTPVKS
ncbi:MAG: glycosyltransferase family 39 protein, partial [Elusimicrobiota bacterium]